MKRCNFICALIIALLVTTAAGCGGTEASQKADATNAPQGQRVALPEGSPVLLGKVKEIVGNEVTVFKGEMPQNRGMAMNFTEETETFLIPVGVPIVSMQRGTGEAGQVALAEIKKDTILRVWKQDGAVTFVQVTGGNVQRSSGQGTQNNRQGTGLGSGGGMPPGMGGPPVTGGSR